MYVARVKHKLHNSKTFHTLKNMNLLIKRAKQLPGLIDENRSISRHIIMKCQNTEKMNFEQIFFLKSHKKNMESEWL